MAVGDQDHGRVAMLIAAVLARAVHQPLDLALGEIAPLDCQVYDAWGAFLGCRFHAGKPCLRASYCIGYTPFLHSCKGRQASPRRQIGGPARGVASPDGNASKSSGRACASPPGGGGAKIENSSRRHPPKFGQKRFLAVRKSWRGNGVACFWATSFGKNFRRRDRDHLVPPRRMDAAVCRARGVLSFRSEAREASSSETPRVHNAARRR